MSHITDDRSLKTKTSKVTQLFTVHTVAVVVSSLKFDCFGLDTAIALLRREFAVRTMEVRIVQSYDIKKYYSIL